MASFRESAMTVGSPVSAWRVVDLRQFTSHQLKDLLEEERQSWAKELQWDFSQTSTFIGSCLDAQRLTGYVLLGDSILLGYSFFVYEGPKAVICNVFASPRTNRAECARLLLRHLIETLQATPGIDRIEAQLPQFSLEDIIVGFKVKGFRAFGRQFMIYDLRLSSSWPILLNKDIELEDWGERKEGVVAALIYESYKGHVDSEINLQYRSRQGALQVVENVTQHQGCGIFEPKDSILAVHVPTGVCCGAALVTSVGASSGHIPQICILPEFQGRGIGTALLHSCFERLCKRGIRQVSLTVTDENSGAVHFYKRLGFYTCQRFGAFAWDGVK